MGAAIGMSTEDLFNDEDLDYTPASSFLVHKQPVGKMPDCSATISLSGFALFICCFKALTI